MSACIHALQFPSFLLPTWHLHWAYNGTLVSARPEMNSGPLFPCLLTLDSVSHQLMATPALCWLRLEILQKFLTVLTHPSIHQGILSLPLGAHIWKVTTSRFLHLDHAMSIFHQNHCNTVTMALASPFISSTAIRESFSNRRQLAHVWFCSKPFRSCWLNQSRSQSLTGASKALRDLTPPAPCWPCLPLSPPRPLCSSQAGFLPRLNMTSTLAPLELSVPSAWNTSPPATYGAQSLTCRLSLNHWLLHLPNDSTLIILFKCVPWLQPGDTRDSLCPPPPFSMSLIIF